MAGERFVLVGLARAQSRWFLDVARWSTSGALPAEFVKALSFEELRARLQSGRPFSALLVDASLPGCDRDLIQLADQAGCAAIVVDDRFGQRHWQQLGVDAVLHPEFARSDLLGTLRAVAQPVVRAEQTSPVADALAETEPQPAWRGRLIAVTGAGGSGRSTVAMGLAAGLAADPRHRGLVVLADLALRAQQGLLHDAGDVVPGLSELVEGHRGGTMAPAEVRAVCFEVSGRGYDLLLGLRRQRDWAALRGRSFGMALDSLRRCYRLVVAETEADVEGEAECGSIEVEERNLLARMTLRHADLVVVAGLGGVTGIHAQVQVVRDLLGLGLPPDRIVPLVNRAARSPRARAEVTAALGQLMEDMAPGVRLASSPVFVLERRWLDDVLRDHGRVPATLAAAVAEPVGALVDRLPPACLARSRASDEPEPVVPGTLGSWSAFGTDLDAGVVS